MRTRIKRITFSVLSNEVTLFAALMFVIVIL